jgi:excisionase family DNA binding protein
MNKKPPQSAISHVPREVALEPLYDAHEVAEKCNVSAKSLHKWAREGKIPAVKFGKLWRFRKSTIDAWLDAKMAS